MPQCYVTRTLPVLLSYTCTSMQGLRMYVMCIIQCKIILLLVKVSLYSLIKHHILTWYMRLILQLCQHSLSMAYSFKPMYKKWTLQFSARLWFEAKYLCPDMQLSISLLFKKLVICYGTITLLTCVMIPQDGGTADLSWEHHFTTLTMTDANKCYKL